MPRKPEIAGMGRAKCSYKNLLKPEGKEQLEISDTEKVPIKIGKVIIVRYAVGGRGIPDYSAGGRLLCQQKRRYRLRDCWKAMKLP